MLTLKIEVTSGLHAGAQWTFDHGIVTLGGDANSEVFLCDEGIPEQCMRLRIFGNRITFEDMAADVRYLGQAGKSTNRTLYAGQSIKFSCRQVQFSVSASNESGLLWTRILTTGSRFFGGMVELVRSIGPGTVLALSCLIGLLATTVILFFGTTRPPEFQASPASGSSSGVNSDVSSPLPPMTEQLLDVVKTELIEFQDRQNLDDFTVRSDPEQGSINIEGRLSRSQLLKFENLLKQIASDHGNQIDILAKVDLSNEQKSIDDIEVAGVLLGTHPALLLRDGTRLFVGANYQGVVLDQVSESGLVFVGSTRYEVPL